jgi:hypothetical protein
LGSKCFAKLDFSEKSGHFYPNAWRTTPEWGYIMIEHIMGLPMSSSTLPKAKDAKIYSTSSFGLTKLHKTFNSAQLSLRWLIFSRKNITMMTSSSATRIYAR